MDMTDLVLDLRHSAKVLRAALSRFERLEEWFRDTGWELADAGSFPTYCYAKFGPIRVPLTVLISEYYAEHRAEKPTASTLARVLWRLGLLRKAVNACLAQRQAFADHLKMQEKLGFYVPNPKKAPA